MDNERIAPTNHPIDLNDASTVGGKILNVHSRHGGARSAGDRLKSDTLVDHGPVRPDEGVIYDRGVTEMVRG
jgi:hypothetical protein